MIVAAALMVAQVPAPAQPAVEPDAIVSAAVDTAITACEDWILQPKSWADNIAGFPVASGLAERGLTGQAKVPDVALPPPALRRALHHWRVAAGNSAGVFVTTSGQLPVCHLAGGGPVDFQPAVEALLASDAFGKQWKVVQSQKSDDLAKTDYVSQQDTRLTMVLSRAAQAGERRDRVQFLATLQYRIGK